VLSHGLGPETLAPGASSTHLSRCSTSLLLLVCFIILSTLLSSQCPNMSLGAFRDVSHNLEGANQWAMGIHVSVVETGLASHRLVLANVLNPFPLGCIPIVEEDDADFAVGVTDEVQTLDFKLVLPCNISVQLIYEDDELVVLLIAVSSEYNALLTRAESQKTFQGDIGHLLGRYGGVTALSCGMRFPRNIMPEAIARVTNMTTRLANRHSSCHLKASSCETNMRSPFPT